MVAENYEWFAGVDYFGVVVAISGDSGLPLVYDGEATRARILRCGYLLAAVKAEGRDAVRYTHDIPTFRHGSDFGFFLRFAAEERISLRLRERKRRVKKEEAKYSWDSWDHVPSGVFEFSLGGVWGFQHRTTWHDSKRQKIEEFLPEIVATFRPLADYMRESRIEKEEEHALYERISDFRWKMDRQRREENEALELAVESAGQWKKAAKLRQFTKEFENQLKKEDVLLEKDSPAEVLLRWLEVRADMMDPLRKNTLHLANKLLDKLPGWCDPDRNEDQEDEQDEEDEQG